MYLKKMLESYLEEHICSFSLVHFYETACNCPSGHKNINTWQNIYYTFRLGVVRK